MKIRSMPRHSVRLNKTKTKFSIYIIHTLRNLNCLLEFLSWFNWVYEGFLDMRMGVDSFIGKKDKVKE
jgi:hypothetical protein